MMFMSLAIIHTALFALSGIDSLECQLHFPPTEPVDTVHIQASRTPFATVGRKVRFIESKQLNTSLQESGQFIKSYGASGSALISKRGADATQTQVLWNGLPINHPMLGMMDFSNINGFGMDQITVVEGGNSAMYGSGSVGGTIAMENALAFNSPLQSSIEYHYSSLLNANLGFKISAGTESMYFSFASFTKNQQNNFTYTDEWTGSKERADNVHFEQIGARLVTGFKKANHTLKCVTELSINDRGLGFIGEQLLGGQTDDNLRSALQYEWASSQWVWVNKVGYVRDIITYHPQTFVYDTSIGRLYFAQSEVYRKFDQGQLTFGIDVQHQLGESQNYLKPAERTLPAIYTAWMGNMNRFKYLVNSRYEIHEGLFTYGFSNEYSLSEYISLKSDIHRSFRRPTLNDIYWQTSQMNPLENEIGWGGEIGINYKKKIKNYLVMGDLTPFYRYLDNPIVWLPTASLWRSMNLNEGRYWGVQTSLSGLIKIRRWRLQLVNNIEYVYSKVLNTHAIAYQQIFVPDWMINTEFSVENRHFKLFVRHNHVGKRFTSTDNSSFMDAYQLIDCELQTRGLFKFKEEYIHWRLGVEVRNIANAEFQNMPGRPMPGRIIGVKSSISI